MTIDDFKTDCMRLRYVPAIYSNRIDMKCIEWTLIYYIPRSFGNSSFFMEWKNSSLYTWILLFPEQTSALTWKLLNIANQSLHVWDIWISITRTRTSFFHFQINILIEMERKTPSLVCLYLEKTLGPLLAWQYWVTRCFIDKKYAEEATCETDRTWLLYSVDRKAFGDIKLSIVTRNCFRRYTKLLVQG